MKLRAILAIALALLSTSVFAQTNQGSSPLTGAKGGTNNRFMQFTGPATSMKTFTLPNVSDTIALLTQTQTLTNKTINCASNTCSNLPVSGIAAIGAYTFIGNNTGSSAIPTAVDIAALTTKASPAAGDYIMLSDQAASGAWKKAAVSSIASAGSVSSLNGQTGAITAILLPQNRLSLTSAVGVTTSDVTGATSVYLVAGQSITSNGTNIIQDVSAQLTLALDSTSGHTGYHQSGKNFDVFRINDGGTIRIGTGPAWTSDTARGTGAGTTEIHELGSTGINTNVVSILIRFGSSSGNTVTIAADQAVYLGSFRATADGQTEDSKTKRLLFNAFNVARRVLQRSESAVSWTLALSGAPGAAGYSIANANSANKVEVLAGLTGGGITLTQQTIVSGAGASVAEIVTGIGLGSSTTSSHTTSHPAGTTSAGRIGAWSAYEGSLALGYQDFRWLEQQFSAGSGSSTSFGTSADSRLKTGMSGGVWQ